MPVRFIGAVRNVVDASSRDDDWPTPFANFGVWASDGIPLVDGTWVGVRDDVPSLDERHWYPLL